MFGSSSVIRVFLSAPRGSLRRAARQRLHEMERRGKLKISVFDFEENMPATGRPTLEVIKGEIERSDVVLVFLETRLGSRLPDELVSYTEEEIRTAANLGREIKIYVLGPSKEKHGLVDPRVENEVNLALLFLGDARIGRSFFRTADRKRLLARMDKDLRNWMDERRPPGSGALLIDDILRAARRASPNSRRRAREGLELLCGQPTIRRTREMRRFNRLYDYRSTWKVGVKLMSALRELGLRPPFEELHRDNLEILIAFLVELEPAAIHLGEVLGPCGAMALVNARLQMHHLLGNWRGWAGAAGQRSSLHYILHQMELAERWNDLALSKTFDPALESNLMSIRASVLPYRRPLDSKDIQTALEKALWQARFPEQKALIFAQYGKWELQRGHMASAELRLRNALDGTRLIPTLWVRAAREWGLFLLKNEKWQDFAALEAEVQAKFDAFSLNHQRQRWLEVFSQKRREP